MEHYYKMWLVNVQLQVNKLLFLSVISEYSKHGIVRYVVEYVDITYKVSRGTGFKGDHKNKVLPKCIAFSLMHLSNSLTQNQL